jgi:opacity protein-like surface antigen
MTSKKKLLILVGAALLAGGASMHAQAQAEDNAKEWDGGWFFGVNLPENKAGASSPGVGFSLREDRDSPLKLSAGYQFSQYLKAEVNYLDFSKPSYSLNTLGQPVAQDAKGKGLHLFGTGTLPLGQRMGLYGKVGAFYSNLDSSCATNYVACTGADRGTDLSLGVGLRYDFTKTVSVRGEWERFHRFGGRDLAGVNDVDFFSVGMGFRF